MHDQTQHIRHSSIEVRNVVSPPWKQNFFFSQTFFAMDTEHTMRVPKAQFQRDRVEHNHS